LDDLDPELHFIYVTELLKVHCHSRILGFEISKANITANLQVEHKNT
jgi:hypothetical protein